MYSRGTNASVDIYFLTFLILCLWRRTHSARRQRLNCTFLNVDPALLFLVYLSKKISLLSFLHRHATKLVIKLALPSLWRLPYLHPFPLMSLFQSRVDITEKMLAQPARKDKVKMHILARYLWRSIWLNSDDAWIALSIIHWIMDKANVVITTVWGCADCWGNLKLATTYYLGSKSLNVSCCC